MRTFHDALPWDAAQRIRKLKTPPALPPDAGPPQGLARRSRACRRPPLPPARPGHRQMVRDLAATGEHGSVCQQLVPPQPPIEP